MKKNKGLTIGIIAAFIIALIVVGWRLNSTEETVAKKVVPTEKITTVEEVPFEAEFETIPASELDDDTKAFIARYDAFVEKFMREAGVPGAAVAIVKDGKIAHVKGFGVRKKGEEGAVDEHTVFRLASVSKTFAPLLTGILVDEGKLDWDTPVMQYLPDFHLANDTAKYKVISLRHVLSHTAGLPRHAYTDLIEDHRELPEMLERLYTVKPINTPGKIYSYQNVMYSVSGEVHKAVTGKDYQTLMHEKVFKPLKMNDASIRHEDILAHDNVALPHIGSRAIKISKDYYHVAPAAGVNASATDLSHYLLAMLGHYPEFISPETLEEILTPQVRTRIRSRYFRRWNEIDSAHYALGWRVLDTENHRRIYYHGGYVEGYRAELAFSPEDDMGVAFLINAPTGGSIRGITNFFYLQDERSDTAAADATENDVALVE